ncbi:hypothetical protein BB561_006635 [Smittium simulii]|uniref:Aerobactin siderophore biosynthesis IucA/IucC N-terminal domain-containing protein n=1 Tax=Smittium simulii TaxID=133385 RepID=A0A2T9Y2U7_9FUNG|nr:hypothetical protein BB561_006635 [Smittium simulii]
MTNSILNFLIEFSKRLETNASEKLDNNTFINTAERNTSQDVQEISLIRAQHATTSRLVTCLVNEGLVSSFVYLNKPSKNNSEKFPSVVQTDLENISINYNTIQTKNQVSFLVIYPKQKNTNSVKNDLNELFEPIYSASQNKFNSFFVFQLEKMPILKKEISTNIFSVGIIDSQEFSYYHWHIKGFFETSSSDYDLNKYRITDPNIIMKQLGFWLNSDKKIIDQVCNELDSSVQHQRYRYENPPKTPDIETWKSIDWENSILEGHATHPMHRARSSVIKNQTIDVSTDFSNTTVRFIAIDRSKVDMFGDFEDLLEPLIKNANHISDDVENHDNYINKMVDTTKNVIIPVHVLQLPSICLNFKDEVTLLPFESKIRGQASLRTVSNKDLAKTGKCIKLPIAIKITSALRTVTPWSTYVGPKLSQLVSKLEKRNQELNILNGLEIDNDVLVIAREDASINYKSTDFDIAKHISCIVRDEADYLIKGKNEKAIICAALTETLANGKSAVVDAFGLDTIEKRLEFLQNYSEKYFAAMIPYIINFGIAFEAHQQNTLLRVSAEKPYAITGFIIRDFGGIKVLQKQMYSALNMESDPENPLMLPDSCTDAHTVEEVYKLGYHAMIQCNMYRLIRALDLHYSRIGWGIVRNSIEKSVPSIDHPLLKYWYSPTIDLKCFMSMKLDSLYRDYLYAKVSNILILGK